MGTFVWTSKVLHHMKLLVYGSSVGMRYSWLDVPMYDGMKMGFRVYHEMWGKVPM